MIMVLGSNGQVGTSIKKEFLKKGINFVEFNSKEIDIRDNGKLEEEIKKNKPNVIINAAAYTNVEQAFNNQLLCNEVNYQSLKFISKICAERNIYLIHFSTDYVFNGKKKTAYCESDQKNPINIYGSSKSKGEDVVLKTLPENQFLILRVSWVFSEHENSIVYKLLKAAKKNPKLQIVYDQVGCPTSARSIAHVLIKIIKEKNYIFGIYNFTNSPSTNWYEFGSKVFDLAKEHKLIKEKPKLLKINTEDYPYLQKRPKNSVLSNTKILKDLKINKVLWEEELQYAISKLK